MINAVLTVGFGALAIVIGFGLLRRARDAESRSDARERAGELLKVLGAFAVLLGFALLIQPSLNPRADPLVATHTLPCQGSGLRLKLLRPGVAINLGAKADGLRDSPRP